MFLRIEINRILYRKECFILFAYSHHVMSLQIQSFVKENSQYSVDTPTFSWANMKPDFIPNLAKRKHYIKESFDFVVDKILSLLKLPSYNLLDKNKRKRIDVEMGIICHFLTDFFCVPHNQRWEFKHHMIPHVKYESILDQKAKSLNIVEKLKMPPILNNSRESVSDFLIEVLEEYEQKKDYMRDIVFSVNVSTAICSYIIKSIMSNDKM